jgi:hypothetical protein
MPADKASNVVSLIVHTIILTLTADRKLVSSIGFSREIEDVHLVVATMLFTSYINLCS